MSVTGERDDLPGGGPQKAGVAITDLMTGMYASVALLAALAHRDRTGAGPVDRRVPARLVGRDDGGDEHELPRQRRARRERAGNAHQNIVPYQVFACADGHVIVAVGNDGQFRKFCDDRRQAANGRRTRASRPTPRACAIATRSCR